MKIHLAPIQGMTNHAYRKAFDQEFGHVDYYYTPFIVTTEHLKNFDHHFKDILVDHSYNLIPQLLSNHGHDFRFYANKISELGYQEINWNIGCPFPIVAKKKRGSGLLPYPQMIKEILDEVTKDTHYKLSIKMRLGLHDKKEGLELMKLFNEYDLETIIIHARTGSQQYEGNVDLDGFDQLQSISRHPIVYNGDIFTLKDFQNFQERFPHIDDIMLGRGALANPLLPSLIKNISCDMNHVKEKIERLHQAVLEDYKRNMTNEIHLCHKMKEFWNYTSPLFTNNKKHLKAILQTQDLKTYSKAVHSLLKENFICE